MRGFLVFFTLLVGSSAVAKVSCEYASNALVRHVAESYPSRGVLTEQHRDAIQKIWDDANLSREAKLQETFQVYADARLELLPEKTRERVEKVLVESSAMNWMEPSESREEPIHEVTIYFPIRGRIAIGKRFMGLPLEVKLIGIVHELEHAIQMASDAEDPRALRANSRGVFFMEASAMSSEWEFAREIRDLTPALNTFVQDHGREVPRIGLLSISLVKQAPRFATARDYLRAQWENGRYTFENSQESATAFATETE